MLVDNATPWPFLAFERRTARDEPLLVVVLQGLFAIRPNRVLALLEEQPSVELGGVHHGDPKTTSLRREGSLATFKPRSDIHLDAVARAPGGIPRTEWPVRVKVGNLTKDLMVRGVGAWTHGVGGWIPSAIRPATSVPITHERAFGGAYLVDGKWVSEDRNPFGTGFLPPGAPTDTPLATPQIVAIDEPAHLPGKRYAPQGFSPLSPHVEPRLSLAGTYDEAWEATRAPCLPDDFDYASYNSAHPDLVYPGYLSGEERVELVHLNRTGALSFGLPRVRNRIMFRHAKSGVVQALPELDTLHLDVASLDPALHRARLTWRSCVRLRPDLLRVEIRMDRGVADG